MLQATAPGADRSEPIPTLKQSLPVKIWHGFRDPLGFLSGLHAKFGDIVALREGRSYVVFRPEYVRHVLQDNHPNYQKGPKYRAALAPLMGNGLFTSEQPFWLRQRRLAQPAFQRAHLDALAGPVADCVADTLKIWAEKAHRAQPIALREELTELTVRIVLHNLFGSDSQTELKSLVPAIDVVNDQIRFALVFLPFHLPRWVPTPRKVRFRRALRTIDEFVYRLIRERRARPDTRFDLLGLLLNARDEDTGERMDDLQLRDELVTMLNAGHDTITDALTWTLILLAQHPEQRQRARREVLQVLRDRVPTAACISDLPFLGRVFHEALRLYPPGWVFARTALADDRIAGYQIPAGALVAISPYVTHRSSRYWGHPELFDPDRFLPERFGARHKAAYFPFGSGPRQCIGAGLVSMEAPLILAAILQKFDFELSPGTVVKTSPRISLRPKGTLWLRLRSLDAPESS